MNDATWNLVTERARELHDSLGIGEEEARCVLNWRADGCRITVTRLSDGKTSTSFVVYETVAT